MSDAFTMPDEDLIEDCCDILGVTEDATLDEIRSAFRRQAKFLHPDRNRSATATDDFIRLGEAYRILRDAAPRRVHDDRAAVAPVVMARRPRWRAAGVVVAALIVSIGAASTFAYLGLKGGSNAVTAAHVVMVAPASPRSRREPTTGQGAHGPAAPVERVALSKRRPVAPPRIPVSPISDAPVSDAQISDADLSAADAFEALVSAPADVAPQTSAPSLSTAASSSRAEDDETLVASLVDTMDAPFAAARANVAAQAAPRVARPIVAAVASPPRHVTRRPAPGPKAASTTLTVRPTALRQWVANPRFVRAYPWRPYPVRVAMSARYPRAPVKRTPRRYQPQDWQVAPGDWPF